MSDPEPASRTTFRKAGTSIMARRLVLRSPCERLELESYAPTPPGPLYIQVKIVATSLNHLDWKRIKKNIFIPDFPHVLGMDIVGHVLDGSQSRNFQKGDLIVAPGTVGYSDHCSFQTHVLVHEDHCAKITSNISVLGLSTLPFSLSTAACGLYLGAGLAKVAGKSDTTHTQVLIWGANGGIGKLAVQLAKMSGYSVIAVTSREETKTEAASRGADHVFSNSDSDLVKKIRAVAPNLRHAFDTVVTSDTMAKIVECCEKPAKVATAIRYNGPKINGVQITPVYSGEIMGKTMVGLPSAAGLELGKWLWGNLDQWIKWLGGPGKWNRA
ncbi:chaperonin 10-like protein [Fusarium solani]|uniref:Chaperonin 10-like protein n=1 Tax=Fusarium solani TaxID=169388 RepID=A0A9P9KZ58_FUSSL|nr:chaperonin 10-like protein [Fusarium solani]KAH7271010.1 chaperonin 10-like protein [Fusarium solani]